MELSASIVCGRMSCEYSWIGDRMWHSSSGIVSECLFHVQREIQPLNNFRSPLTATLATNTGVVILRICCMKLHDRNGSLFIAVHLNLQHAVQYPRISSTMCKSDTVSRNLRYREMPLEVTRRGTSCTCGAPSCLGPSPASNRRLEQQLRQLVHHAHSLEWNQTNTSNPLARPPGRSLDCSQQYGTQHH